MGTSSFLGGQILLFALGCCCQCSVTFVPDFLISSFASFVAPSKKDVSSCVLIVKWPLITDALSCQSPLTSDQFFPDRFLSTVTSSSQDREELLTFGFTWMWQSCDLTWHGLAFASECGIAICLCRTRHGCDVDLFNAVVCCERWKVVVFDEPKWSSFSLVLQAEVTTYHLWGMQHTPMENKHWVSDKQDHCSLALPVFHSNWLPHTATSNCLPQPPWDLSA